MVSADFDIQLPLSPPTQAAASQSMRTATPTFPAHHVGRPRSADTAVPRTQSPWKGSAPTGRLTPLSVDTYSTEVTARVQPGPGSTSGSTAGRDSPRPLVFDIEVGRRLPDEDVDAISPLERISTMPRPDTPSNVW